MPLPEPTAPVAPEPAKLVLVVGVVVEAAVVAGTVVAVVAAAAAVVVVPTAVGVDWSRR